MHFQGPLKINHARKLIECSHNAVQALKDAGKNLSYAPTIQLGLKPGVVTDSELMSFLKAFESALSKFAGESVIALTLQLMINQPEEDELVKAIEGPFKASLELSDAADAAKPKLVVPAHGVPKQ